MRWLAALVALPLIVLPVPASADAVSRAPRPRDLGVVVSQAECGGGTYSIVNSPDGASISVLFDDFSARADAAGAVRATCAVRIPLNLPAGYSLGVFRMDYRGFAHLDTGQAAQLNVYSSVGRAGLSRNFRRAIKGAWDGDFTFSDAIGAGVMKRAGCGEEGVINLSVSLDARPNGGSPDAMVTLDSVDGTAPRGVVFHVDLKKCRG